jgi:phenylacetate-CoA ligase
MVVVRGVNLYPSAIEKVIRAESEVAEFRVELGGVAALAELRVIVEPIAGSGDGQALRVRLERALRETFHLRLPVALAAPGSLPRFELKARRWLRV